METKVHQQSRPDEHLTLSSEGAEALSRQQTGQRVSKELIEAKIATVGYVEQGTTTICIVTTKAGFAVHGVSGCVDPANYNQDIGRRYAYDDAFKKLLPLEGYLLAEIRYAIGMRDAQDMIDSLNPAPMNHGEPDV